MMAVNINAIVHFINCKKEVNKKQELFPTEIIANHNQNLNSSLIIKTIMAIKGEFIQIPLY